MNKNDLINVVAEKTGLTKVKAGEVIEAFVGAVHKSLKKGDSVTLVGFGTFSVSKRAARNGVNPQTKERIKIKARKVAKFRPGKALREDLNKGTK